MKTFLLAALLLASSLHLRADAPLHSISLKSTATFEVVSPVALLSVYALSDGMKRVVQAGSRKSIEAADYSVGILVRTKQRQRALQDILRQIHEQTGRPLGKFINTALEQAAPNEMLMAADADSVWFLVLTPKGDAPDTYLLTCAYLIDRKKEANEPRPTAP